MEKDEVIPVLNSVMFCSHVDGFRTAAKMGGYQGFRENSKGRLASLCEKPSTALASFIICYLFFLSRTTLLVL